jgi:hypothetical protein
MVCAADICRQVCHRLKAEVLPVCGRHSEAGPGGQAVGSDLACLTRLLAELEGRSQALHEGGVADLRQLALGWVVQVQKVNCSYSQLGCAQEGRARGEAKRSVSTTGIPWATARCSLPTAEARCGCAGSQTHPPTQ